MIATTHTSLAATASRRAGSSSGAQAARSPASEVRAGYNGPVVRTQDFTVFNVTKEAVVARQARVTDQLPSTPGIPRVPYTPVATTPPEWWAEARVPLDDAPEPG